MRLGNLNIAMMYYSLFGGCIRVILRNYNLSKTLSNMGEFSTKGATAIPQFLRSMVLVSLLFLLGSTAVHAVVFMQNEPVSISGAVSDESGEPMPGVSV